VEAAGEWALGKVKFWMVTNYNRKGDVSALSVTGAQGATGEPDGINDLPTTFRPVPDDPVGW